MPRVKGVLTKEEIEAMRLEMKRKEEAEQAAQIARDEAELEEERAKMPAPTFSKKNITATKNEMANTVNEKIKWLMFSQELGKPDTDEEVWQRICDFWHMCSQTGEVPQKSDFYLYLGVAQSTVGAWREGKGCSRERAEMIQRFDDMYNSVRDSIADKGLINTIAYIWQSKQFQNYCEPTQRMEITSHNPMQQFPDANAIEQKYSDLLEGTTEVDPKYLASVNAEGGNE